MTQTDVARPDVPASINAPAHHDRAPRRYGVLMVLAVGVLVISSALGSLAHSQNRTAAVEAAVLGRCKAVNIAMITHHTGNDFTKIVIGQAKAARHSDGSWSVVEPGTLSGHVVNGVPDGDTVSVSKTCDFSRTAAQSPTAPAERLKVHFDGTRATFTQEFTLDQKGTGYTFSGGEGLRGP